MPEPESKKGKTKRELPVLGLVLAGVLLGAVGLAPLLSAFIEDSPERTAAEPVERQSNTSVALPESDPPTRDLLAQYLEQTLN